MKAWRILLLAAWVAGGCAADSPGLLAGAASREITPHEPVPMWGYGARRDALSQGVLDPLFADAVVLQAGGRKLAIVGIDAGRSPSERSMERIRARLRTAGIEWCLIAASHTHHGPVLELSEEPGKGQGRFDAALRYYRQLEESIVQAVLEANARLEPAGLAAATAPVEGFNRNRHTKLEPKPVDRDLGVLRLAASDGKTIALLVNFAAHPTLVPASRLEFSGDWVGAMKRALGAATGAHVVFLQGASGDLSAAPAPGQDYRGFGEALARQALALVKKLTPETPAAPSIQVHEERFRFRSRTDFSNPLVRALYSKAFFPELVANYADEYLEGIEPRLTVVLLNGEVGLVGISGEVFCAHAIRLKQRARLKALLFAGCANGYHQYFPTIEAVAEGGYGADAAVSPVEIGAGERLMDAALVWLYRMAGRIRD
ncbi:MAG: hypothetical protein RMI94_10115 [Bryobacterales bacterium]|nr:hypothetical protein [Bryobacterales bacterium]